MQFKYTNIPKKAFLYAGFEKLSYLRYLTLYTLSKLNPDWEIYLYKPICLVRGITWGTGENNYTYTNRCYFDEVNNLENVKLLEFDFKDIDLDNNLPEVHKSDFLRWYLLSSIGGLWSDIDVLYFKPLSCLNSLARDDIECFYCYNLPKQYHSIGFNISAKGNIFYETVWKSAKASYTKNSYQCVGRFLLEKYHSTINPDKSTNLPMDIVYSIDSTNIGKIYQNIKDTFTTERTIGIHWYAGSPISFAYENTINDSNFFEHRNILTNKFSIIN